MNISPLLSDSDPAGRSARIDPDISALQLRIYPCPQSVDHLIQGEFDIDNLGSDLLCSFLTQSKTISVCAMRGLRWVSPGGSQFINQKVFM